jgi:hypothetical protein
VTQSYIIDYKDPKTQKPMLHVTRCPEAPETNVMEIGMFAGCFTAMRVANVYYPNAEPCSYCCGALI